MTLARRLLDAAGGRPTGNGLHPAGQGGVHREVFRGRSANSSSGALRSSPSTGAGRAFPAGRSSNASQRPCAAVRRLSARSRGRPRSGPDAGHAGAAFRPGPFHGRRHCAQRRLRELAALPPPRHHDADDRAIASSPCAAAAATWRASCAGSASANAFVPGGGETSISTKPFKGNRLTSDPGPLCPERRMPPQAVGAGAIGAPTVAWLDAAFRFMKALRRSALCA